MEIRASWSCVVASLPDGPQCQYLLLVFTPSCSPPLILFVWPIERGKSKGMSLVRLGHKRHGDICLSLMETSSRGSHFPSCEKRSMMRNWGLQPTSKELWPPANSHVSGLKGVLWPQSSLQMAIAPAPFLTAARATQLSHFQIPKAQNPWDNIYICCFSLRSVEVTCYTIINHWPQRKSFQHFTINMMFATGAL